MARTLIRGALAVVTMDDQRREIARMDRAAEQQAVIEFLKLAAVDDAGEVSQHRHCDERQE